MFDPATGNGVACLKGDKDMFTAIQMVSNGSIPLRIISGSFGGAIVVWQKATGMEWDSLYRIAIAKAISESDARYRMEAIFTARLTRQNSHKLRSRAQGSSILTELSLNGVAE